MGSYCAYLSFDSKITERTILGPEHPGRKRSARFGFLIFWVQNLVGECEAAHARLDAQDVVVHCEHLLEGVGVLGARLQVDSHLGVINAREIAGAGRLVLLGLQGEGVHVDAGVGRAGVVQKGNVLVEVLADLLLETILAVENHLEVLQGADLVATDTGAVARGSALLEPEGAEAGRVGGADHGVGGQSRANGEDVRAAQTGSTNLVAHTANEGEGVGSHGQLHVGLGGTEVPQRVVGSCGRVGIAPDQLLHGVIEGQAHGGGGGRDGITTGVLNLLDQVLVALLGEAAALLGVQVHVVGPDLQSVGAEIGGVGAGQVEVKANLVVLQGNQGQVQAGVAVEEEQQGQVHVGLVGGVIGNHGAGRQLAVGDLVGLAQEHLGVQTEPGLVVLVDALAANGQLHGADGALGQEHGVGGRRVGSRGGQTGLGQKSHIHIADQIAVAGNGHGHTATVGGGAVHGLLNVLHGEVRVTLVHGLEKGHLRLTGKIHILSAIGYELHKSSSHFVIYSEKIILGRETSL